MKLSDSDINHLRRLLGFIRCEIGQSPEDYLLTIDKIASVIGDCSEEGKGSIADGYLKSVSIPQYVRAAVKALEKVVAEQQPRRAQSKSEQRRMEIQNIPHLPFDSERGIEVKP